MIKILQKAIIFNKGKILILKRANNETLSGTWDFPGGNLDFLESKEEAIKREIKEETGLKINKIKQIAFTELIARAKEKHYLLIFYKANTNSNKIKLSREHDDCKWINPNSLSKYKLNPILRLTAKSWGNYA